MPTWVELQKDFSRGEVGARVMMRDDSTFHDSALLQMMNYMPTLQGSALRIPGTEFISEVADLDSRIIPYLTPTNEKALVILSENSLRIITGLSSSVTPDSASSAQTVHTLSTTPVILQIAKNPRFEQGLNDWEIYPIRYTGGDGNDLGMWLGTGPNIVGVSRAWKYAVEIPTGELYGTAVVPDPSDGDWLKVRASVQYEHNFSGNTSKYSAFLRIGTTKGAGDIWEEEFIGEPGAFREFVDTITGLSLTPGQTIHTSFIFTAIKDGNQPSTPQFRVAFFEVFAKSEQVIDETVIGVVPYSAADLADIQYVQSPYMNTDLPDTTGKELVLTHPSHPPYELIVSSGAYIFREKSFNAVPDEWSNGNYPAACGSFHGRLILAGSQDNPIPGDPVGSAVETVWGTEVGRWNELITATDPQDPGVNADDSIEFTSIYRSPIQWVFGQKDLLIGATEMEYVASADGIFQPADIGVFMQSTHGSARVQPVALGPNVLFAAQNGTKVRAMGFQNDEQGWVAPDLTLLHPELFSAGIRRMIRMRNPQQMILVVMATGQVAILHQDPYAGISGWSRINLNANVIDACVISDDKGADILMLLVQRYKNNVLTTYLEAIGNWVEGQPWEYVQSHIVYVPDTTAYIIPGLDHLNGENVQVVADGNFIGVYQVVNNEVQCIDGSGEPIYFNQASVGLSMPCEITTLPIIAQNPDDMKRYNKVIVRGLFSGRPIINGERPPDRDPPTRQNQSQAVDVFKDFEVTNLGWDKFQFVTVAENLPIRSEIVGIFGLVRGNVP